MALSRTMAAEPDLSVMKLNFLLHLRLMAIHARGGVLIITDENIQPNQPECGVQTG